MSLKYIAEQPDMGSWTYVSSMLNEQRSTQAAQRVLPLSQQ